MLFIPLLVLSCAFAFVSTAHASSPTIAGLNVSVSYADSLRLAQNFPNPWDGSPATTCIGCNSAPIDAGAIRLDNVTSTAMDIDSVSVNVHGNVFNLWGAFTIPPLSTMILTQTSQFNFDMSDFPITSCGVPADPANQPPLITVTPHGQSSTTFTDSGHVLDTGGFDSICQQPDESIPWTPVGNPACQTLSLNLTPASQTDPVGTGATVSAEFDACGSPLPNSTVDFTVGSGPNAGTTGSATTDSNGIATFSYSGTATGTDNVTAKVTNVTGGEIDSNGVTVVWVMPTLPGGGAFVVGDQSSTGHVMFWGAQWANSNMMSGGAGPDAFKGFAMSFSPAALSCGGTFSAAPGNSAGEPSTIPALMAVIVSSHVSKSGNTITGVITHIVLVKTGSGYMNDPGHPGVGEVVATIC